MRNELAVGCVGSLWLTAHLLFDGDIAYYVSFVVAAVVFAVASKIEGDRPGTDGRRRVLASAGADLTLALTEALCRSDKPLTSRDGRI
jgi:hypothetical protein